jgi:hypothetical protein
VPPSLELRDDDLVHVEEAVLRQADVDERGLHPGQDVVDDPLVDVARDRAPSGSFEVHLGDAPVLEDGHALLADVDGDDDLFLDLDGRAARARRSRLARRPAALRLGLLGLGLFFGDGDRRRGLRLLLPPPAAARSAPAAGLALRLCRSCLFLLGRLGSGRLDGRLLLAALAPAKPWHVSNLLSGARRDGPGAWPSACQPQTSCRLGAGSRSPDSGSVLPARTLSG